MIDDIVKARAQEWLDLFPGDRRLFDESLPDYEGDDAFRDRWLRDRGMSIEDGKLFCAGIQVEGEDLLQAKRFYHEDFCRNYNSLADIQRLKHKLVDIHSVVLNAVADQKEGRSPRDRVYGFGQGNLLPMDQVHQSNLAPQTSLFFLI